MTEEKTEAKEEKPTEKKSEWVKMKPAELEKLVVELYKQGESAAKIGIILRDKHGVPKAKLLSKKILKILKENNIGLKHEKDKIQLEIDAINKHIEKNKHDQTAKRKLVKQLWALKRVEHNIL